MIVFSYIKHGFGNKLFIFIYLIHKFKKENADKLYIVQEKSIHEEGNLKDEFTYIFPNLKNIKWLEFITWKEYDSLKQNQDVKEITYDLFDWLTSEYILQYKSFIKNHMALNESYNNLLEKYDVKNGIAIHIRYGDKLDINKLNLKKKLYPRHLLMKPEYYIGHCNTLLSEKRGPIYIFTDSEDIVKKLILPFLPDAILTDEPYQHVFYLLTKFRRQVISESTMSAASGYFNHYKHRIIAPYYFCHPNLDQRKKPKIVKSPFMDEDIFELDKNKEYITFTL